jgi:hypothetical protein
MESLYLPEVRPRFEFQGVAMKRRVLFLTITLVLFCRFGFAGQLGIDRFLGHYKPSSTLAGPMTLDRLQGFVRNGQIPLSMSDLIALTLENNLDIRVSRLNPVASEYLIRTAYKPFEATLTIDANMTSDAARSRTQLTGVDSLSQFVNNFSVGYFDKFESGTDLSIEFTLNRTATNDAFRTFNPAWFTSLRYQFTQHFLNGFGSKVNTRSIRVARNNKTISDAQFEQMLMDTVSEAEKTYWDLIFAAADNKVKRDSLALAEKTLHDNEIQVEVGGLAKIEPHSVPQPGGHATRGADRFYIHPDAGAGPDQEATYQATGSRSRARNNFSHSRSQRARSCRYSRTC